MSDERTPTPDLLTAAQVRQWQQQLAALEAEEAEMKARHAREEKAIRDKRTKLNKLVRAASEYLELDDGAELVPEPAKPADSSEKQASTRPRASRSKNRTWRSTIFRIVKNAGRGVSYAEVKEAVSQTHLGKTLARTEKSFYGAIGRLANDGQIVRHNGKLYTPQAYRQFMEDVAAGRAVDEPARSAPGHASPNDAAVIEFLTNRPNGAASKEIINKLLNDPPAHLAVSRNKGSLYNVLARMRENGDLIQRGDRYFLPRSKSEAPDPSGPSASHSDGDEGGASSSSGSKGNGASSLAAFRVPARHTPGV